MEDTKKYKCLFNVSGGYYGETDDTLSVEFELTDEEYKEALKILDENDRRFSYDLPDAMHETILDAAYEHFSDQTKKLAEEVPDEYSEDDIYEIDTEENIFEITDPVPID